jgi:hypothetical protein
MSVRSVVLLLLLLQALPHLHICLSGAGCFYSFKLVQDEPLLPSQEEERQVFLYLFSLS